MPIQLSIKEVLQLKNETAKAIIRTQHTLHMGVEYGTLTRNGEEVTPDTERPTFHEEITRYHNLLELSHTLHQHIGRANTEHGIPDLVRERQNYHALLRFYEQALKHTKPYTRTRSITVLGGGVEQVREEYTPHITSTTIKNTIKQLKGAIRDAQTEIDRANLNIIEIETLNRDDIEDLLDA